MSRFFSPKPKPESKMTSKPVFDFPELSTKTSIINTNANKMNYKNKLEIEPERQVVKPGHISIFYDTHTRKVCIENKEIPTNKLFSIIIAIIMF